MDKKERPVGLRVLNALCATVLVFSGLYILFSGFQAVAVAALVCAAVAVATPVMVTGEGGLEILTGILDAFLDGIMGIFEAIASFISGLFG